MTDNFADLVKQIDRLVARYETDAVEFPRDTLLACAYAIARLQSDVIALEMRDRKLLALEAHGVDNWEGYGDAMKEAAQGGTSDE